MTVQSLGVAQLSRSQLDDSAQPAAVCDALFSAVLTDDEVDPDAKLPTSIQLDFSQPELIECFRLCRQLWISGFDRQKLLQLTVSLSRNGDLDGPDRLEFKYMRAKFKHFRYATALYGGAHRYSTLLDLITITMGQLQDAYCNDRGRAVTMRAFQLRLLLTRPLVSRLHAEANKLLPTTSASFRALLRADAVALEALVANSVVTGPAFHRARKVVGRQVSFWDTLRTLRPSRERYDMSRSLSAINGLMGELHDELVQRRAEDRGSYDADFELPEVIRARIQSLISCYQWEFEVRDRISARPR